MMKNMYTYKLAILVFATALILSGRGPETANGEELPEDSLFGDAYRSFICTETGYAYLGSKNSSGTEKEKALSAAKRSVLRKVHAILENRKSRTGEGVDFAFPGSSPKDCVKVIASREIEGMQDSHLFAVQITAEVPYRMAHSFDQKRLLSDSSLPLTAGVWTEKKQYVKGEEIVYHIRGNKDFYGAVIHNSPDGETIRILPNEDRNDPVFKGNNTYLFPDLAMGDFFVLDVNPPFGKETIHVFACTREIGEIGFSRMKDSFGVITLSMDTLRNRVREVASLLDIPPKVFDYVEFFEDQWIIRTKEK